MLSKKEINRIYLFTNNSLERYLFLKSLKKRTEKEVHVSFFLKKNELEASISAGFLLSNIFSPNFIPQNKEMRAQSYGSEEMSRMYVVLNNRSKYWLILQRVMLFLLF